MIQFQLVTDQADLPYLSTTQPTFCDVESGGLYIDPRLVQVYQSDMDKPYIIDLDHVPLDIVKEWLQPQFLVAHNSSYDLGTLNLVPENLGDTLFATRIAFPEFQRYGLDLVIENMGFGDYYKDFDKKAIQKMGFHPGAYLSQLQLRYSVTDVIVLEKIWNHPKVQDVVLNNLAYKVDIISQKYAARYQQNGLVVNQELRHKLERQSYNEVKEYSLLLPSTLNVNSSPQVRKFMGTEDARYETLVQIANSESLRADDAMAIIKLKSARKSYGYAQSINYNKMYTRFNVYGAATGRFSSTGGDIPNGFNAQQIPRMFQKCFVIDTEDTKVISLDYSTLELRLAAAIYNEPTMYQEFMDGKDLHTEMAIASTGKKLHPDGLKGSEYDTIKTGNVGQGEWVTKNDRTLAKSISFGYVFGMSAKTYQQYAFVNYGVKMTLEEATRLRDIYFEKYRGIGMYHKKVWNNVKKPGFTYKTALGRVVKPRVGTEAINGPVQGSGGETTKLAVHYLCREYPEALKYIFNVVHDAIYMRVPKKDEEMWKVRLKESMELGWTEIMKCPIFHYHDIPMKLEYED